MVEIDIEKFVKIYRTIYVTLYKSEDYIDYKKAVNHAEFMMKNCGGYKRLVKQFYEFTFDVPTSDRELAAFGMTVRAYNVLEGSNR